MKKVHIIVNGSYGDLTPFINIGLALKRHGHEAVFSIPEDVENQMSVYDFEYKTYLKLEPEVRDDYKTFILDMLHVQHGDALDHFDEVNELAKDADFIIRNPHACLGPIVAEYNNIPCVDVFVSPMYFNNKFGQNWFFNNLFLEKTNALRNRLGLAPTENVPFNVWESKNLKIAAYPEFYIEKLKVDNPEYDQHIDSSITRFTNFPPLMHDLELSLETEQFLAAGEPPVCFDMGTGGRVITDPKNLWEIAYELGKNVKRMIILHQQGDFPDHPNVHFLPGFVPHHKLFPRCSLVINHGGLGTIGKCLWSDVPQASIPQMLENALCANLMSDMMTAIEPDDVTYEKLAELIADPKYNHELAKQRGDYIREHDGVEMIIDILKEYKYLDE